MYQGVLKLLFGLKPLGNQFFDYLNELAEIVARLDKLVDKYLVSSFSEKDMSELSRLLDRKRVMEKHITRGLTISFITPFDREDILNLAFHFSHLIQNYRLLLLFLQGNHLSWSFLQTLKEALGLLSQCAARLKSATAQLASLSDATDAVLSGVSQLNAYCHQGQESTFKIISRLYTKEKEFAYLLKCRDLIQILLAVYDAYETLSWSLKGVIIKYA